jgi:hypothetical protein
MRTLGDGVHVLEAPQRFYGLEVGARMTVLETDDGVLVHSPLGVAPDALGGLGRPRWVVAPNRLHHLYVGPWIDAGCEGWAAPGLPEKRPDVSFAGVLDEGVQPFGADVQVIPLQCFPFTREVVLLHRPSRTLVVTDLVFHFTPRDPWWTRAAMTCALAYPGCCTSVIERVGFRRDVARREMAMLASLDFDRLIMAHGEVIETGGKEAFRAAMGWLGI